ncbi:MAG: aminodeoxychorismate synthase component I [Candidatus Omnitrophica bacterium]|nr:aminodeoxychorismate synthase component I [Candidatus Omnitrophota bacterium]
MREFDAPSTLLRERAYVSAENQAFQSSLSRSLSFKQALAGLTESDENFFIFASAHPAGENTRSYIFTDPCFIVTAYSQDEVGPAFCLIEKALEAGYYAGGYVSYEAAKGFDACYTVKNSQFPLLWFGIFKKPCSVLDVPHAHLVLLHHLERLGEIGYEVRNLHPSLSFSQYAHAIERIKSFIEQGLTYQVNFTFQYLFSFAGSPFSLFSDLLKKQPVSYASFLNIRNYSIVSISPELFFKKCGETVIVKPMKGTAQRGRFMREDEDRKRELESSPKNRAENLMIVDLLRNDLGRVCKTGSIKTKRLFEVEPYHDIFQMTSTIEGHLDDAVSYTRFLKSLFPSGSVTGAPKIKTMQLIDNLEPAPRDVYTGAIGLFCPDDSALFNVAIRTAVLDKEQGIGRMGIGSGIVYDSDAINEYEECLLKAQFLVKKPVTFRLLETMLWHPKNGYFLLELHLERLGGSARYFGFLYTEDHIRGVLEGARRYFVPYRHYRIRLTLDMYGAVHIEYSPLPEQKVLGKKTVMLWPDPVDSNDIFLFHKTTHRAVYDAAFAGARTSGHSDALFFNEKNEVTEGATTNVFVKKDDFLLTPPIECGLLNGVYRRHILKKNPAMVKEAVITKEDLFNADRVYLSNSVRGLFPVTVVV